MSTVLRLAAAAVSAAFAVAAAWPWSPAWPPAARVVLAVIYGSAALAAATEPWWFPALDRFMARQPSDVLAVRQQREGQP